MNKSKTGFTLIELLTVIGIIGVLAALLFPVFATAREAARKTSCLSNQRQIGSAATLYTQDYDECFPTFTSYCQGARIDNPLDASSSAKPRPMWQWKIYPYHKSWQIYSCPSDSGDDSTNDKVRAFYNISYGYNYGYLSRLEVPGVNSQSF